MNSENGHKHLSPIYHNTLTLEEPQHKPQEAPHAKQKRIKWMHKYPSRPFKSSLQTDYWSILLGVVTRGWVSLRLSRVPWWRIAWSLCLWWRVAVRLAICWWRCTICRWWDRLVYARHMLHWRHGHHTRRTKFPIPFVQLYFVLCLQLKQIVVNLL